MGFIDSFKVFGSKVFGFFLPLIQKFLQDSGPIIISLALKYVPQIAATMGDKDGETKRKAVIDLIVKDLQAQGIAISMNLVNAAIEMAVAYTKPKV
jgi:hypothetical protein